MPVYDRNYQVPIRFTGRLEKLTIAMDLPELTPEAEKKLMEAKPRQVTPSSRS